MKFYNEIYNTMYLCVFRFVNNLSYLNWNQTVIWFEKWNVNKSYNSMPNVLHLCRRSMCWASLWRWQKRNCSISLSQHKLQDITTQVLSIWPSCWSSINNNIFKNRFTIVIISLMVSFKRSQNLFWTSEISTNM